MSTVKDAPSEKKAAVENGGADPCGLGEELEKLIVDSHGIARRVLPLMSERGIPVTPSNYRLFYDYFSGGPPELVSRLDEILQDRVSLTPELTQSLYQRFYSLEATESLTRLLDQAGDQVQALVVDFIKMLLGSIAQTGNYGRSLGRHVESMDRVGDIKSFRDIVSAVMDETGAVIRDHTTVKRRMEKTTEDLAKLQEELRRREELAHTDELTGLANRRAFNIKLAEESTRAWRYGNLVSLIMIDLDDFKKVNDAHGHLVGDRLLSALAKTIKQGVRGPDLAARYGGEEFAVICPQTDLDGTVALAERLRKSVEETEFIARGTAIRITISVGAACLRTGESMDELIDRCDRALYSAKKSGKNRACSELDLACDHDR
ncbi:MAG: GGDEF domain-containing protein [Pseudomonadota bacterium]